MILPRRVIQSKWRDAFFAPLKFSSSPLKSYLSKRKGSSSNFQPSFLRGELLNFGGRWFFWSIPQLFVDCTRYGCEMLVYQSLEVEVESPNFQIYNPKFVATTVEECRLPRCNWSSHAPPTTVRCEVSVLGGGWKRLEEFWTCQISSGEKTNSKIIPQHTLDKQNLLYTIHLAHQSVTKGGG